MPMSCVATVMLWGLPMIAAVTMAIPGGTSVVTMVPVAGATLTLTMTIAFGMTAGVSAVTATAMGAWTVATVITRGGAVMRHMAMKVMSGRGGLTITTLMEAAVMMIAVASTAASASISRAPGRGLRTRGTPPGGMSDDGRRRCALKKCSCSGTTWDMLSGALGEVPLPTLRRPISRTARPGRRTPRLPLKGFFTLRHSISRRPLRGWTVTLERRPKAEEYPGPEELLEGETGMILMEIGMGRIMGDVSLGAAVVDATSHVVHLGRATSDLRRDVTPPTLA